MSMFVHLDDQMVDNTDGGSKGVRILGALGDRERGTWADGSLLLGHADILVLDEQELAKVDPGMILGMECWVALRNRTAAGCLDG